MKNQKNLWKLKCETMSPKVFEHAEHEYWVAGAWKRTVCTQYTSEIVLNLRLGLKFKTEVDWTLARGEVHGPGTKREL